VAACASTSSDSSSAVQPGGRVAVHGPHQSGISTPAPPQTNLLTVVSDLEGPPAPILARMGSTIEALASGRSEELAGLDPGDLTITVGVGPRLVAEVDPSLPGAAVLPAFAHEELVEASTGGDLMVQICASDPLLLPMAQAALTSSVVGGALSERWRQQGFRGDYVAVGSVGFAPRNVLGFVDGIVVPRAAEELDADVWLQGPPAVAGGTVAVVRRMEVQLERFLALPVAAQEDVIGRRRSSAVPLSGGSTATSPDLEATTAGGRLRIPAHAHLRASNPTLIEVPTMLRRSYSFADSGGGLLFVSFQNGLSTFIQTLERMDADDDALLPFTTTTASGSFLILPGFQPGRPLGATLFGNSTTS
jgi:dye decolorizing peroxidase